MVLKERFDETIVAELVRGEIDGPATRWLHRGMGSLSDLDTFTALSAVEAALRLGDGERLAAAREEARDKHVRKEAGAAIHQARSRGVDVPDRAQPRRWVLGVEPREVGPPLAWMGLPDDLGVVPTLFAVERPTDVACATVDLDGVNGFADGEVAPLSRAGAREAVAQIVRERELVAVTFVDALRLARRAFDAAGRSPLGWHLIEEAVSAEIRAEARDPGALLPAEPDGELLESAVTLLSDLVHPLLTPSARDRVREPMLQYAVSLDAARADDGDADDDEFEVDCTEIARILPDAILADEGRQRLAFALECAAFVLEAEGSDHRAPAAARHTASAIRNGTPAGAIPLVRHWSEDIAEGVFSDICVNDAVESWAARWQSGEDPGGFWDAGEEQRAAGEE